MSETDRHLDASMDALFRRAGGEAAPREDDDERAASILQAAIAAGRGGEELGELVAAPALAAEPGEPGAANETFRAGGPPSSATSKNGSEMSDETPKPPPSRRPSLKELAESVKNRPSLSGVDSQPPSSRPAPHSLKDTLVALDGQTPAPPSSYGAAPASRAPASAPASGPPSSAASSRASSPGPVSVPASGPSSARPVAVAPMPPTSNPSSLPSTKPSAGVAKGKPAQGSSARTGIAIAVVGLAAAAAFAFWSRSKTPEPAPTAELAPAATQVAPAEQAPEAAPAKPDEAAEKPEGVIDINQLADATEGAEPVGGPLVGGPLPATSGSTTAVASKDPSKPAGPGENLDDAIRDRAGGGSEEAAEAEPAAGAGTRKNVPDIPATGAVTSAINAVKGGAKGCVAGAEEPSSATITFSSSGAVQSVAVGGWAQGKSAAGCIKSALSSARVPPFAKPTYTTSVTIRP